jgi:RNA polymerase sigma factor (sigma-70 family)
MAENPKTTFSSLTGEAILVEAFERLRPKLLAMIGRLVGPGLAKRVDVEGVAQDAYLRASARWPELSPKPFDLTAWLYGQTRDQAVEAIRAALGPSRGADRDVPWLDDSIVDSLTGPSTAAARNERREVVRLALQILKPIDREIVILHYFDGLNFAQIGTLLDLTQNTANQKCARALLKLKSHLPDP